MRRILYIFLCLLPVTRSFAQTSDKDLKEEHRQRKNALALDDEDGLTRYKSHYTIGGKLISDGYGFTFELGKTISNKLWLFQFEFAERRDPRERKQQNPNVPVPDIVYGKENFFYPIKLGVQREHLLGIKAPKSGLRLTANYGGGICLGILRPYYVEIEDSVASFRYIKYN